MSIDRFWAKTTTDHDEGFEGTKCILWTASAGTKNGHGRFSDKSKRFWVVHRFAWALVHGDPPSDMVVWHRCPSRLCVNHLHLELITAAEAIARRIARFTPALTFRCCGRPRTPENSYPSSGRCKRCHKVQQRACNRKKRKARRKVERKSRRKDVIAS